MILFGVLLTTSLYLASLTAKDDPNKDLFLITIDIQKDPQSDGESSRYPITITITNTQDTAVSFVAMTCSWEESFSTDSDDVYIEPHECDSNFPERIVLAPSHLVKYSGYIKFSKKSIVKECHFKVGLRDITFNDFIYPKYPERQKKYKTYWSRSILLTRK